MKKLKDVLEASILDIDGTFKEGDNLKKEFEEAQKDWKKLINSKRTKEILRGQNYKLHIKSSSLAKYLCRNIPGVDLTNLEFVDLHFKTDDVLWSNDHYIAIQVSSEDYIEVKSAHKIKYDDGKDNSNTSDVLSVKEAIKIIINNIAHSKYLQNIEDVREEFEKCIWFKRKNMNRK